MSVIGVSKAPYYSLGVSIERVKKVYEQMGTKPMARDVLAGELGYQSLSGTSVSAMASLRKYGLIEGRTDSTRVSSDGQILAIDDPQSNDYREALGRCARRPQVFQILDDRGYHGGSQERAIAIFLEKSGMSGRPAQTAGKNFIEAMTLVEKAGSMAEHTDVAEVDQGDGYSGEAKSNLPSLRSEAHGIVTEPSQGKSAETSRGSLDPQIVLDESVKSKHKSRQDVFSLDEGNVVIVMPEKLSEASYEDFSDWLELIKRKAKRTIMSETTEE